jgi:hypothetical protein
MGWREYQREHFAQLANEYRDESVASWLGGALLMAVAGGIIAGGALYLLDWAFQAERNLLRSFASGALSVVGYQCGRRYFGWLAHRRRARRPQQAESL